jgi:voltage-gated potassium channel
LHLHLGTTQQYIRRAINDWFQRHEVAWELAMGALAIGYVILGELIDDGIVPPRAAPLEYAITAVFVAEFATRIWAAENRRRYLLSHATDLIALIPAARGLRVLRLLRLVRLIRTVPLLYRRLGLNLPVIRRLAWHANRMNSHIDRRLLGVVGGSIGLYILTAALIVTFIEKPWTAQALGDSFYWAVNSTLGSGDPGYVASAVGWGLSWSLIGIGLTILAVLTGAIVTFVIDIALKEGRGMGAAGYHGHIVVCGWNASARELIEELRRDEYGANVVLVTDEDKNPAGAGVYFVSGDPTNQDDLERAGIREAATAVVFPDDETDAADMRSILVVLAVESMAPAVRTVVQVNNSRHVEHMRRANADEIIVPSQIAAHLAARSALYPGLTDLVADIVSGGEGSELYRIQVPESFVGLTVQDVAVILIRDHRATMLALIRNGTNYVNPPGEMTIERNDDALVVAESIATLAPLPIERSIPDASS